MSAGVIDNLGEFHSEINENFFLTDPSQFVWTHFPLDDSEENYSR